jgi:hypothetical protein
MDGESPDRPPLQMAIIQLPQFQKSALIKRRQLKKVGAFWLFVNMTGLYSNHLLADIDNVLKVLNDI